jgi:hypothetical protein
MFFAKNQASLSAIIYLQAVKTEQKTTKSGHSKMPYPLY